MKRSETTRQSEKMTETKPVTSPPWPDWVVGLLMIEAMSIATGLLMPITSNARGSEWHLADVFGMTPSYFNNAFLWYLISSGVLLTIGSAIWLRNRARSDNE